MGKGHIQGVARKEMEYGAVLDAIHKEILKHGGRGFTVEVNAEVTKYKIEKCIMWTSFWVENTDVKYISWFHRNTERNFDFHGLKNSVELDISISKEVEIKLPSGMTVTKTNPVVLFDTRGFVQHHVLNHPPKHKDNVSKFDLQHGYYVELDNPEYVEGRRVYLTVSHERASQLNNAYASKCLFRNQLLNKYTHILKDIVLRLELSNHTDFEVRYDGIYRNYYDEYGRCSERKALFKEFTMEDLSSYTQLYGMALAILDVLETPPDFLSSKTNCTISDKLPRISLRTFAGKDSISVSYYDPRLVELAPPPPPPPLPPQQPKELKKW